MKPPENPPVSIEIANPAQYADVLQSILTHLEPADIVNQVNRLVENDTGANVILAACQNQKLVGGIWVQFQAGKTASLIGPAICPDQPRDTLAAIIQHSIELITERSEASTDSRVDLIQVLLEPGDVEKARAYREAEFRHVSDLLYMVSLPGSFPQVELPGDLKFIEYNESHWDRMQRVVDSTYVETLDCPGLEEFRQTDDVLTGYAATGSHNHRRWFLIQDHNDEDIGCLLLTDHSQDGHWELVYMGIIPEARGNGQGLQIVKHAQLVAFRADCERIVLAVDAQNAPAIAMYAQAGFLSWDRKSVLLRTTLS